MRLKRASHMLTWALLAMGLLSIENVQALPMQQVDSNSTNSASSAENSTSISENLNRNKSNAINPYYIKAEDFQIPQSLFFQFNIGAGFLYFSDIKGNTYVKYEDSASTLTNHSLYGSNSIRGPISYNRSPVFESILGYRFNHWFKMALSYQHQGNISVQTPMLLGLGTDPELEVAPNSSFSQLRSSLCLDALFFKIYFESPHPMIWRGLSFSPFIAAAVGPGW